MRPRKVRRLLAAMAAGAVLAGTAIGAGVAKANPVPGHANCDVALWGFLGSQRRIICDGPVGRDGSWMRERLVFTPAHMTPTTSSCSSGSYSSYCTIYPGGWVDDYVVADDTYTVTEATVLSDEPGHLGAGTTV